MANLLETNINGNLYVKNGDIYIGSNKLSDLFQSKGNYQAYSALLQSIANLTTTSSGYLKISNGTPTLTTPPDTDTKNTAGSGNSTSKLYLIGATSQSSSGAQTYSGGVCMEYNRLYYTTSNNKECDYITDLDLANKINDIFRDRSYYIASYNVPGLVYVYADAPDTVVTTQNESAINIGFTKSNATGTRVNVLYIRFGIASKATGTGDRSVTFRNRMALVRNVNIGNSAVDLTSASGNTNGYSIPGIVRTYITEYGTSGASEYSWKNAMTVTGSSYTGFSYRSNMSESTQYQYLSIGVY